MTGTDYENLLADLVTDFRDVRPYVVLTSETALGDFTIPAGRLWGMHGAMLDLTLRDQLGDRWTGRRPAVLVDDVQIAFNVADLESAGDIAEELVDERVLAVVLHEAAHALEKPFDLEEVDPEFVSWAKLTTVSHLATAPDVIAADRDPWHGHMAGFIRLTLHLIHRAEQRGHQVVKRLAFNSADYCLSSIHTYGAALGDEPEQMAGKSFAEIRGTDMPQEFLTLWRGDVARWYRNQPKLECQNVSS